MPNDSTLEAQLADLIRKHDLTALSLHAQRRDDGTVYFGANAHCAPGLCANDQLYGENPAPHRALTVAIENLQAKRAPAVLVPELVEAA